MCAIDWAALQFDGAVSVGEGNVCWLWFPELHTRQPGVKARHLRFWWQAGECFEASSGIDACDDSIAWSASRE